MSQPDDAPDLDRIMVQYVNPDAEPCGSILEALADLLVSLPDPEDEKPA